MDSSRTENIHNKGFNLYSNSAPSAEYKKIKVGVKTLDDAVLKLGYLNNESQKQLRINKASIFKALAEHDYPELRRISEYFYNISGIYKRTCNYFAFLYRYDWYVAPEILDEKVKEEKVLIDFSKILNYLDNSYLKKKMGEIALEVVKKGCYYGYIVDDDQRLILQQLPADYCRTRYSVGDNPAVEFNMVFFDTFKDLNYRMKILKLFPDEFLKGYSLYKQGKLLMDDGADARQNGWYLLDPEKTVKFNFNNSDIPIFVDSIPAILDLDEAQDLDRRKQMQKLLKILIQKLPRDKNGDLIFDVDEARDIHNNAVAMLRRAIGVDVLTTFTDVESIDLSDKNTTASTDDLEKVERAVFNTMGISRNLFNTDGNLSLEKSILNDEASVRNLLLQFGMFLDRVILKRNKTPKKYNFKIYLLETTQYNYQNLSKMYKEQTQLGYSRMLPQIALGHSQSSILNAVHFESEILSLNDIMIPPLMSSTMSGADLDKKDSSNKNKNDNIKGNKKVPQIEEKTMGRPEKPDDQKSEKTIQNEESMS